MVTRSVVLWGTVQVGRPSLLLYVCPPSRHVIVKSVTVLNGNATAQEIEVYGSRPSKSVTFRFHRGSVPTNDQWWWEGWVVLEPGDEVYLNYGAGPVSCWGFGAELPVP